MRESYRLCLFIVAASLQGQAGASSMPEDWGPQPAAGQVIESEETASVADTPPAATVRRSASKSRQSKSGQEDVLRNDGTIELIIGGQGKDGVAKRRRIPVID